MSYDPSIIRNRQSARDWELAEDVKRVTFLRALDRSTLGITDFEREFMNNYFEDHYADWSLNWWTPRRREVCDEMRKKYGGAL